MESLHNYLTKESKWDSANAQVRKHNKQTYKMLLDILELFENDIKVSKNGNVSNTVIVVNSDKPELVDVIYKKLDDKNIKERLYNEIGIQYVEIKLVRSLLCLKNDWHPWAMNVLK